MDTGQLLEEDASASLQRLKEGGLYRNFVSVQHSRENFPVGIHIASNREVIDFASSDYLGLSVSDTVCDAAISGILTSGVGSGGSHNLGGRYPDLGALERLLAEQHRKGGALLFNSGYSANIGVLRALAQIFKGRNPIFFSDEWNHRSIIEPIRGEAKRIYTHNDLVSLESLLSAAHAEYTECPKIIVFEGLYSMDGSIPNIKAIVDLAKKYNAIIVDDEVHAVGMYGENACGICEEQGVMDEVDIIVGGFGKAHGSTGGYVVASTTLVDYVRSFCPEFIFTSSSNHPTISASLAATKYLMTNPPERAAHQANVARLKELFDQSGIPFAEFGGHIIPVMIGDAETSKAIANDMLKEGILVRAAFFPSVPKDEARLRIIPNAAHTEQHLAKLAETLKGVLIEHGVIINGAAKVAEVHELAKTEKEVVHAV